MEPFCMLLLLQIVCITSASVQINYVIPVNQSLPQRCTGNVCHTLDEYVEQRQHYFVSGATFEFLEGNHILQHPLSVIDAQNLAFTGDSLSTNSYYKINVSQEAFLALYGSINVTIKKLEFFFAVETMIPYSRSVFFIESSRVSIVDTTFEGKSENLSLLMALNSSISIVGSNFENSMAYLGGAIIAINSEIVAVDCFFFGNKALSTGGAIYIDKGTISLERTSFRNNFAAYGGAVAGECTLNIAGNVTFSDNSALYYGGALYLGQSTVLISDTVLFYNNTAPQGGAVSICVTIFRCTITSPKCLNFTGNAASLNGGALLYSNCDDGEGKIWISGHFENNTAGECGGAMHITSADVRIDNAYIRSNRRSALCFINANVSFNGVTRLLENIGKQGGGMYSQKSSVSFRGPKNIIYSNIADNGGAIYSVISRIHFSLNTLFQRNEATTDGGALYALGSDIVLSNQTQFNINSASRGGAMYFEQSASLTLDTSSRTYTTHNHAEYGGVIYSRDITSHTQCTHETSDDPEKYEYLAYCFIVLNPQDLHQNTIKIYSINDSSENDGIFLFGGLLDRCQNNKGTYFGYTPYEWMRRFILRIVVKQGNATKALRVPYIQSGAKKNVSSLPYQLCLCEDDFNYNCSMGKNVSIYMGQKLHLTILALDQSNNPVSSIVKMVKSSNTRLLPNQDPQPLQQGCAEVKYNVYSNDTQEQVVVYPDGPCHDSGLAGVTVYLKFLACPSGFNKSGDHCTCEDRLQEYANCFIDDSIYIVRKSDTKVWMGVQSSQNGTYQGLILYTTCPADYCTENLSLQLTLDTLNDQCNSNRRGLLCGSCAANHSLMLGSSKCQICSNWYIFLLLLFAAAGIVLVTFLSVLRLTVSTGFLNSIILYSNIVQVNHSIFFTDSSASILTVFVAWMNLDFGFQVCFYNGMNAYAQTWLQFAFPFYVWVLVGLIIVISRYSITVSKLIGHNPIAVLATVILMSYTKILKIIIEVFSSVELEYPGSRKVVVWLKDANVPYLQSKHLTLTVVTVLILVFFFLPFTLLLLLGYKPYQFSRTRRIVKNFKPILDAYYAPYKPHTCYWTGFLLLVRCALYIVFSYNSLGGTRKSLLAINIVFTALLVINWLSIYRMYSVTIVEGSVFLNLIILSTSAMIGLNSPIAVNLLTGAVFVTMLGIITYHFHIAYTAKSKLCMKLKTYISKMKPSTRFEGRAAVQTDDNIDTKSPQVNPSKSIIDLREPLLEK